MRTAGPVRITGADARWQQQHETNKEANRHGGGSGRSELRLWIIETDDTPALRVRVTVGP